VYSGVTLLTFFLKKSKLLALMRLKNTHYENNKDSYMKVINSFLIVIFLLLSSLTPLTQADETPGTPKAYFPETAYTFEPVISGEKISHTYVVQNKGSAPLVIQKVHTG
jgi:hypothetical protein